MIDYILNKELVKYSKEFGYSEFRVVDVVKVSNVAELMKKIKGKDFVVVKGGSNDINRVALESKGVDILLDPQSSNVKDFMRQRNSGLNQVLCKLAKNNDISIGFSFSEILKLEGRERAIYLGRVMQNIRLCKKYKVRIIFGSFAVDKYELRVSDDIKAFARILGLNKL